MSTREMAISIIENMTEEQREAFVLLFEDYIPRHGRNNEEAKDINKMINAFEALKKMRKKVPDDFDYDKELAEYRDERYGR